MRPALYFVRFRPASIQVKNRFTVGLKETSHCPNQHFSCLQHNSDFQSWYKTRQNTILKRINISLWQRPQMANYTRAASWDTAIKSHNDVTRSPGRPCQFTRRGRSKKFQHFHSRRQKSLLTSVFNVRSLMELMVLAPKASIYYRQNIVKFCLLSTLFVLKKGVYLIRRGLITNRRFRFFTQIMAFPFSSISPQPNLLHQPIRTEAILDF